MAKNVFQAVGNKATNWANKVAGVAKEVSSIANHVNNAKTTNLDAVSKYLFGYGETVKLTDIAGVSDTLVKTSLKSQIDKANQELLGKWLMADTPYVGDTPRNKAGYWGSTQDYDLTYSQLFFMGNGQLFASLKSDGESAKIHYYLRDEFKNPGKFDTVTLFIEEIPFADTYKINWDMDSRWYSTTDAKSVVGVIGSHPDYSWLG